MDRTTIVMIAVTLIFPLSLSAQNPEAHIGTRVRVRAPTLDIADENATFAGWAHDSVKLVLRDVPVSTLAAGRPGFELTSLSSWTQARVWAPEFGLSGQEAEVKMGGGATVLVQGERFSMEVPVATVTRLVFITSEGEPIALPMTSLETIDVYQGRKSKALVGAGVGGVVGFIGGWGLGQVCFNVGFGPRCEPPSTGERMKTAVSFGMIGAGLGALIGSKVRQNRWTPLRHDQLSLNVVAGSKFGITATVKF